MTHDGKTRPHVHLMCGLNGAGKTTHARQLESELPAVRFTLDEWMLRLHQLRFDDRRYPPLAAACQDLIWDTAQQVLRAGVDVVLDWNLWNRHRRGTWRAKVQTAGWRPILHYVRVSLEVAIARAAERTSAEAQFVHHLDAREVRHLHTLFEEPTADEGMDLRIISG